MLSERPSRQGQFCWYELITTDPESAKTFYSNVMGWGALNTSIPERKYIVFRGPSLGGRSHGFAGECSENGRGGGLDRIHRS
jgi:predicted enzyme related to lactoylglutathione lyase